MCVIQLFYNVQQEKALLDTKLVAESDPRKLCWFHIVPFVNNKNKWQMNTHTDCNIFYQNRPFAQFHETI